MNENCGRGDYNVGKVGCQRGFPGLEAIGRGFMDDALRATTC